MPDPTLLTAPLLPRVSQHATAPLPQPTPPNKKKRGRSSTTTSTSSPTPPAEDTIDVTIDAAASFTYPDPADTDTNPLLLPCYLPSILPSPHLFQHVLHHFGRFHLRFTGLANAIHTTSGTLSAVLHRKYAFKAIGVVKGIREWMSGRDANIARLIAADIKQRWASKQRQQEAGDERKEQPETKEAKEGEQEQEEAIDWEHPAFRKEAVEPLLPDVDSGLKYGPLMDFLRHRVSVAKKQKVEDMLVEYIGRLEAEREQQSAIEHEAVVKREAAVENKDGSESRHAAEAAPLNARGRPKRVNSAHYYNEEALAGEDLSADAHDERKEGLQDEDVQLEELEMDETKETEDDEDSVKAEGDSDARRMTKKRRSGSRPSTGGGYLYPVSDEPRWPARHPFQSPLSRPAWSIRPFVTHPFDAASSMTSATATLSFQASGTHVTLQPFTAISSPSSTSTDAPSLLLHAGGSIDAMAWAPVGSPAVSPSAATHYLLVAPSHTKYRSFTPCSGKGVLCLWRVRQQLNATLVLAIEHDRGGVMDLRWYPRGVWQEEGSGEGRGRLGVLAVGFTDGSVVVLAVPHPLPDEVGARVLQLTSLPHVVLVPPPLDCRLPLPVPVPTSLAFSPHASPAYLAIGQSHSAVVVYALSCLDPASSSPLPAPSFHLTPRLGHQAVRALTFSPANPHQLLLATGQGDILVIDLRSPFHPIAAIPGHTSEPMTALHCLSSRPSVLVTASRNRPRLHFLLQEAGDIRVAPLRGLSSLRSGTQRQDAGTCWCVDVLEDEERGATLAVCGWSDGRVDVVGWRTAESELDRPQCRIRRLCWLGWTRPDDEGQRRLLLGEGGTSQQLTGRTKINLPELDNEQRVELSGVEMALDEQLAVHHVRANPNVVFPRQIAVGGLAGIVRIQQVSDM